jgi:hypothetical protein
MPSEFLIESAISIQLTNVMMCQGDDPEGIRQRQQLVMHQPFGLQQQTP